MEGFIPDTGRGIQAGTSHCLGQKFSKMFDIGFEAVDQQRQLCWQNSWGLSTRSLGIMIMVHGDDKVRLKCLHLSGTIVAALLQPDALLPTHLPPPLQSFPCNKTQSLPELLGLQPRIPQHHDHDPW